MSKVPQGPATDDFRTVFRRVETIYCRDTGECLRNDGQVDRAYFRSRHWRRFRRLKLRQVDYRCQKCGEEFQWGIKGLRPRIHHLTYRRLGRELLSDCSALCEDCHGLEHAWKTHDRPE